MDSGEISFIPECVPIEVVELPATAVKVKKGQANINCNTRDKSFKDVDMNFQIISGKAEVGGIYILLVEIIGHRNITLIRF